MTQKFIKFCMQSQGSLILVAVNLLPMGWGAIPALSQATTNQSVPAASASKFLGTIVATGAGLLTIKTDAGTERKVTVPDGIRIQRIAPGEKDLSKAAVIEFSALAVGDRVLVRLAPEPATDPVTAISIVAIPQADLAQKQQKEREDWQRNGVGGLVKSIDAPTGVIVITSGVGPAQKTITLHTNPASVLRRYATDSVNFDQSKTAPIETIHPGDQLRARGAKSADGTDIAAEEVVSGSFRNISGTIATINAGTMTLTLKDLATKQTVAVHVGPDAQMRKLPENMARMLAFVTTATTNPGADGNTASANLAPRTAPAAGTGGAANPNRLGSSPNGQARTPTESSDAHQAGGIGSRPGFGHGDPQQMLSRAPAIHLADLQKGDAIMLVSTQGSTEVTAITLLAGVEPLLQAPASTQNMLLSNWNMSSGGAEAAQ